jgi:hypothetical protein
MNAKEAVLFKLPKSSVYGVVVIYNEFVKYQKQEKRLDEMLKEVLCYSANARVPARALNWLNQRSSATQETYNKGIYLYIGVWICDLLFLAFSKRGYSDMAPDGGRDRSRGRSPTLENGDARVRHSDEIKIAFDDLSSTVLLIALKQPERDLYFVRSTLDQTGENQLVSPKMYTSKDTNYITMYTYIYIAPGTRFVLCLSVQSFQICHECKRSSAI